jgi:hypothetical protein
VVEQYCAALGLFKPSEFKLTLLTKTERCAPKNEAEFHVDVHLFVQRKQLRIHQPSKDLE